MARTNSQIPELRGDADEDEVLRYAIALSLQERRDDSTALEVNVDSAGSSTTLRQSQTQFGSLLLDRKAMEEERLKRQKKRRRSSSSPDFIEIPPPKKESKPTTKMANSCPGTISAGNSPNVPYPNATVKRTWSRGFPRTGDDIKIEEVLQKDQLELAVISSYQWDEEWMISKLDMKKTKLLLVAFAKDENQKAEMRDNVPVNIRFCFPAMHGIGAMHSKLQLLRYAKYLRVVIPTGNLVPYDWGETGVMENMVFLIDLPRLANPADYVSTMFSRELQYFLTASGIDDKMVASLSSYDFSRTANIAFVHTIPGGHTGEMLRRVGYCGLASSVAALGLANPDPVEVDFMCASLGSVNHDLIMAIYNACQGNDGIAEHKARASRTAINKAAGLPLQVRERFRIYFPTDKTVAKSRGGRQAGATICVLAKWWMSPNFPRELVRDSVNTRDGLLMHSKLIFVRPAEKEQPGSPATTMKPPPAWVYVGSANLSESAWGRLSKDKSTGNVKMNCRNWESGVILSAPKPKADPQTPASIGMNTFAGTIPVPIQVPGPVYGRNEKPWFYSGL